MNVSVQFAAATSVAAARRKLRSRWWVVTAGLCLVVLVLMALALTIGDYPLPVGDVVRSLLSPFTGEADPANDFIVLGVRLPRAVTGLLAGAALGLSGAIFQTVLRNPLASPDIVGITTGASTAAVIAIIMFHLSGIAVAASATGGAVAISALIYVLSWRGGVTPYRLVLVGIGMAAISAAITSYMFTRARIFEVQQAMAWLTGSLNGATFEQLMPLALGLLVLAPLSVVLYRPLSSLELGDDAARALGTRIEVTRLGTLLVAVVLASFATATVGPLAFVAFASGPVAKRLLGPAGNVLLPAALVGGAVTIGADLIAQHALGRSQLPAGVVTGAVGAMFLIYLLAAANRSGRGG
jgi:iron complex transport system permease protein